MTGTKQKEAVDSKPIKLLTDAIGAKIVASVIFMTPLIICYKNNRASENLCFCTRCSVNVNFQTLEFFFHFLPDLITIIAFIFCRIYFFVLNLVKCFFL